MKLSECRIKRGLSQAKLSEKSGVNLRSLQNYEQGHRKIETANLFTICRLAQALECSISDIIDDKNLIDLYEKVK